MTPRAFFEFNQLLPTDTLTVGCNTSCSLQPAAASVAASAAAAVILRPFVIAFSPQDERHFEHAELLDLARDLVASLESFYRFLNQLFIARALSQDPGAVNRHAV